MIRAKLMRGLQIIDGGATVIQDPVTPSTCYKFALFCTFVLYTKWKFFYALMLVLIGNDKLSETGKFIFADMGEGARNSQKRRQ